MPMINKHKYGAAGAWRRVRKGLPGMRPDMKGAFVPPSSKPQQAFATPPSGRNPAKRPQHRSVLDMPKAFVRPVAPPISSLGRPSPTPQATAYGVSIAPTRMAPQPTPGTLVFGVGLTPMKPAPNTRGTLTAPSSNAMPVPKGVSFAPAVSGAAASRQAQVPTRAQHMSLPVQRHTASPALTSGYNVGVSRTAAAPDAVAVSPRIMAQPGKEGGGIWGSGVPDSSSPAGEYAPPIARDMPTLSEEKRASVDAAQAPPALTDHRGFFERLADPGSWSPGAKAAAGLAALLGLAAYAGGK